MRIGVLALQGAFIEHQQMLDRLGVSSFQIRNLTDLHGPMDGLILPGGESTAMGKLLKDLNLYEPIKEKIQQGLQVFGTCAGLILLSKSIDDHATSHFGLLDVHTKRNAYGRQLGSFQVDHTFDGKVIPMVFIRAPYIDQYGKDFEVLSTYQGKVVAGRQNNMVVTAFHPELTHDTTVHECFIRMIQNNSL